MDPEEARQRVDAGGTLLCMGVPAGTEMTVDLSSLVIGHKFRGIKMIPPGLHLLCWDAGRDRHAAFFFFERSGVAVWRWDEAPPSPAPTSQQMRDSYRTDVCILPNSELPPETPCLARCRAWRTWWRFRKTTRETGWCLPSGTMLSTGNSACSLSNPRILLSFQIQQRA